MDTAGINSRSAAPDMEHSTGAMPCRQAVLPFYRYGKRTWIVSRLPCAILTKNVMLNALCSIKNIDFLQIILDFF